MRRKVKECEEPECLTILLVLLSVGHLAVVLQVKPLDAPPHQVLPTRLH